MKVFVLRIFDFFSKRRWLAIYAALPFLVLCVGTAVAQCKPGDILIGEDADNYYCQSRIDYEGTPAQKYGAEFCREKTRVEADQNAIRQQGFSLDTEQFEMYGKVGEEQQAKIQHQVLDALLDQGLAGSVKAVDYAKSLNPVNVNKAISFLNKAGLNAPGVTSALRAVAAQSGKPGMAAAYKNFVVAARGAKEGWDLKETNEADSENKNLRLLLAGLKIAQGNYELGLVVQTAEFGESFAYLFYLDSRVDDLSRVTDDKLLRLNSLSERLKGDVAAKAQSKLNWQTATAHPGASPSCGQ